MRPLVAALALPVIALGLPHAQMQQTQDPSALLAAARAALGGDSVLNGIRSLTASGSITQDLGPVTTQRSLEISYQGPDKFLRTTRTTVGHPAGSFVITTHKGFNASSVIDVTIAPGAPMPVVIPGPPPNTPEEAQAAETRKLQTQRFEFARLWLPLFAAEPDAYPVAWRAQGPDVLVATASDGKELTLHLDPVTRRPVRLGWMAPPIVMMTRSSTVTLDSRGQVRSESPAVGGVPPLPPSRPDVEWWTSIEDYKTEAGVTWPRRFRTSFAGQRWDEVRISKYKINPSIKPSVFAPRR